MWKEAVVIFSRYYPSTCKEEVRKARNKNVSEVWRLMFEPESPGLKLAVMTMAHILPGHKCAIHQAVKHHKHRVLFSASRHAKWRPTICRVQS
jgi:hypothetical protein